MTVRITISLPSYLGELGYRVDLAGKADVGPVANYPFEDVPGFPKGGTSRKTPHHKYAYHVHNNVPEGPAYPIRSISDGKYRLIWNLTPEATYVEKHIEKAEWYLSWKEQDSEHAHAMLNRYKHRPQYELYDITKDPYELNNLTDNKKYSRKKAELITELEKWMKQQNDSGADLDKPRIAKNKRGK